MKNRITRLCFFASILFSISSIAENPGDSQFMTLLNVQHRFGIIGEPELLYLAALSQHGDLKVEQLNNLFSPDRRAEDRRRGLAANLINGSVCALQPSAKAVAEWALNKLSAMARA